MKKQDDANIEELIFDNWSGATRLEIPLSRASFFLVGAVALLITIVFFAQSFALGVVYGDFYTARARANVNKEIVVSAYRGIITDRFGVPLVENIPIFRVSLDIGELYRLVYAEQDMAIRKIADAVGIDADDIRLFIADADIESGARITIARDVSSEMVINLRALNSPLIVIEDDYKRRYPDASVFAHVMGYTKITDFKNTREGSAGLEALYDARVRGTDGISSIYRDARGNVVQEKRMREARAGAPFATTIDAAFQKYFSARFKEGLAMLGRTAGVGIAMNPKTGEILALVSFPSFDNNNPAAYLTDSTRPLFNRAVSGVYSPASIIKPLVGLAALHERLITPSFTVYSPGYLEIPNAYNIDKPIRFLDWRPQGMVNIKSALARSSNVFFYIVGGGCVVPACKKFGVSKGLGITKLREYWQQFGLNTKTGIDVPGEAVGFLPDPEEKYMRTGEPWRIGDTYNVSIGQGDLGVTPIRLITFFSSIANNGITMKPHLLLNATPEIIHDYSSWKDELKIVRQGLRDVVGRPYGTASALYDLPYKTSGKTGSAQVQNNEKTNAFFIGYGPSSDPQIVVLILVEDAKTSSLNAVPIGYDVMRWYYNNRL